MTTKPPMSDGVRGASSDTSTAARPPGRPRSARADEAIIQAVLDMLASGTTVDSLSMDALASTAGVGKATIYRRWPNKEALILDAVATLKGPVPQPTGKSVREDLLLLLQSLCRPRSAREIRIFNCLLPEIQRNPELRASYEALVQRGRNAIRTVLHRGIATGELRSDIDIDLVIAMLTTPLLARMTMPWSLGLEKSSIPKKIIDTLLAGIAGPALAQDAAPAVSTPPPAGSDPSPTD